MAKTAKKSEKSAIKVKAGIAKVGKKKLISGVATVQGIVRQPDKREKNLMKGA